MAPGVVTLAGGASWIGSNQGFSDGTALGKALFDKPLQVLADIAGNVLVTDHYNQRIRRISLFNSSTCLCKSELCLFSLYFVFTIFKTNHSGDYFGGDWQWFSTCSRWGVSI